VSLAANPEALRLSSQLAKVQAELRKTADSLNIAQTQKRHAEEERGEALIKIKGLQTERDALQNDLNAELAGNADCRSMIAPYMDNPDGLTFPQMIAAAATGLKITQESTDMLSAIWFAMPPQWRPADQRNLAESAKDFAAGWDNLTQRQRQLEGEIGAAQKGLRSYEQNLQDLQTTNLTQRSKLDQQAAQITALELEVQQLTPTIAAWAVWLGVGILLVAVAMISHRMGWEAHP
jgi:septal ring factor EnvC (AmiA/AmiB activator)